MVISRSAASMFFSVAIVLVAQGVSGQDYPSKPIRIVTGPAGGGGDFTARQIAQAFTASFGQPVIIDNRSGVAQGEAVVKAPPDGYTLFVAGGNVWIAPLLQKTPYEVVRDFAPVAQIERTALMLTSHPSVPVKSVQELVALAKAKPGQLDYASSAIGGTPHLAVELFKYMAGVDIVRIPYKGSAPALIGLISGEAHMTITDVGLAAPHAKSGRLRALAVTSAQPSALAPGLPTVAASGVPGYEAIGMTGMFTPAKTATAIITKLSQEILRALSQPDVKERFLASGVEPVGASAEQFAAAVRNDIDKLGKLVKDAGIKAE
jgi:tripartite-type tricarboxylate transporter receptor subunit TctC